MSDAILKPCPFCGTSPAKERDESVDPQMSNKDGYRHWVECQICGAATSKFHDSCEDAVSAWNRRDAPHSWGDKKQSSVQRQGS